MITDTHCHIFSNEYFNPQSIIDNLENDNIKRIIVNGYDKNSNKEVIELINNERVYGALGIHPDNIDNDLEEIKAYIESHINDNKIIAIGEIGLDYYHNDQNKEEQIKLLEYFLSLAEQTNLPVIIHNREATDDLLRTIKKYKVKGIIHCFSGSIETAREYIKLGYKLGIGGVVTFKNSKLPEVLKQIDIKNILLETDSPYLTPMPLRGLPNEPYNINLTFKKISEIYGINKEELELILEANYHDTFDKN